MTLGRYTTTLEDAASDQDLEAVQSGLNAHNAARSGRESRQRLAAFLRDASGQVAGGAIGWTWGEVADIRVLWCATTCAVGGMGGS